MRLRYAVPLAILVVLFLPLPFVLSFFVFSAVLAASPRGEPLPGPAVLFRPAASPLLRGPPR